MSSPCIFCASRTSSNFGDGVNVKKEEVIIPDDNYPTQLLANHGDDPPFLEFEGDSAIKGNLRSFFILKRIFKLSNETLSKFLTLFNDNGHPEDWISACVSCAKSVRQFFQILKQISSLERQLIKVETELNGKLEETKDFQRDENPVWTQIRRHVFSNSISQGQDNSHIHPRVDPKDIQGNPGGTQIRREILSNCVVTDPDVVDDFNIDTKFNTDSDPASAFQSELEHPNEEQVVINPPPISEHPSSSLYLDPVDNPHVLENNKAPRRKRKRQQPPTNTTILSNYRSWKDGGTAYRGCLQCPYYTPITKHFETHLKLHEEGAPHKICDGCGYYLRPAGMGTHLPHCTGVPKSSQIEGKKYVDTSDPNYTAFTRDNKRYYVCRHCPYETLIVRRILKHAKLHEEGAQAEVCEECGWFVGMAKMVFHFRNRHGRLPERNYDIPREKYTVSIREEVRYYKCNQCPFQTRHGLTPMKRHMKLHEEGSKAKACEQCGSYVLPERMKQHQSLHHSNPEMSILPH